jgi:SAM-dependent methyltransferase
VTRRVRDGISSPLMIPWVYRLVQGSVGVDARRAYIDEYVRPKAGERVLDIGCGPGDMVRHLPEVEYVGFDANSLCIRAARRRHGGRGTFVHQGVGSGSVFQQGGFDVALATGVLHHLEDAEARELFRLAYQALRPGGRFVSLDGCSVEGQSAVARLLLSLDRGRHVRDLDGYLRIARDSFPHPEGTLRHDLLRIPYTHAILRCWKPSTGS